jgi:hypothetical protein
MAAPSEEMKRQAERSLGVKIRWRDGPAPPPRRASLEQPDIGLLAGPKGQRLGKEYNHNPHWLARALGVAVEPVPVEALQNPERPDTTIYGRIIRKADGSTVAQIASCLGDREAEWVLAHELAHHHLGDAAIERHCDEFAGAFLEPSMEELGDEKVKARRARQFMQEHALR